jgi:hypothetical protein
VSFNGPYIECLLWKTDEGAWVDSEARDAPVLPALVESIARRYQRGSKALTPERHARLAERPKRRLMRSAARASTPSQWDLPTLRPAGSPRSSVGPQAPRGTVTVQLPAVAISTYQLQPDSDRSFIEGAAFAAGGSSSFSRHWQLAQPRVRLLLVLRHTGAICLGKSRAVSRASLTRSAVMRGHVARNRPASFYHEGGILPLCSLHD